MREPQIQADFYGRPWAAVAAAASLPCKTNTDRSIGPESYETTRLGPMDSIGVEVYLQGGW